VLLQERLISLHSFLVALLLVKLEFCFYLFSNALPLGQQDFTTRSPSPQTQSHVRITLPVVDTIVGILGGETVELLTMPAVAVVVGVLPNQSFCLLITHRLKGVVAKCLECSGHETLGQIATALI